MDVFPIDVQLLVQTLLYFASVLAGFTTAVLCGVTQNTFQGRCFLYVSGPWLNCTYIEMKFGNAAVCNFVTYGTVICCIAYALGVGCYFAYGVYASSRDPTIGSQMWVMPFLLANSAVLVVLFIISCVLGVGLTQTCHTLMASCPEYGGTRTLFENCQKAENFDLVMPWRGLQFNFGRFFTHYTVAQTASWINVLFWIGQIVLGGLRFYRNRKLKSEETFVGDISPPDIKPIADQEPTA